MKFLKICLITLLCMFFYVSSSMGSYFRLSKSNGEETEAHLAITVKSALATYAPYYSNDLLTLSGVLSPDPDDLGKKGEVYIVAFFNGEPRQKDASGNWQLWDYTVDGLIPAMRTSGLEPKIEFSLLSNFSQQSGNFEFFVGYKVHEEDVIKYNFRPITISINPFSYSSLSINLKDTTLKNEAAYISSQCYTKTKDDKGFVHNPCYACHLRTQIPNYINDDDLQLSYDFPEYALTNHWINLFKDKTAQVAAISDEEIIQYVKNDNYIDSDGEIILAKKINNLPYECDYNGDGKWNGYFPDCYFNFDHEGFDRTPKGDFTGWRAFAYYPFLGTFWPTNGSTDDVLIRLDEPFKKNETGEFDLNVYKLNLAIVEALITRKDVSIDPVDETIYQVDLDKDGKLAIASKVKFDWAPPEGRYMSYVGEARLLQNKNKVHLAAGLFPEGTEFLHSVRYIDVYPDGSTGLARRMKELRYAKKNFWLTYADLQEMALDEVKDNHDFPDRLRQIIGNMEQGVSNGQGWIYQGFIEDINGNLRPQTYEENVFCIGCHSGIGATTDGIFSFPRKFAAENSFQKGWYHWSQKNLKNIAEPKVEIEGAGAQYEYSYYILYNHSGNEFRDNQEVIDKFFNTDGTIKVDTLKSLHDDITVLLNSSKERALNLNKAYRTIVSEQSFIHGRDANITPSDNVFKEVPQDEETGVKEPTNYIGNIFTFADNIIQTTIKSSPVMDQEFILSILGNGMTGPDGKAYGVTKDGLITKSTYHSHIEDFFFPFPNRLTLPTRVIVPNSNIPSCYECHRIYYPVPPDNPQIQVPVFFPSTLFDRSSLIQFTSDPGYDTGGQWSPDGSKIAWISDRTGGVQVWVMNSDGTGKIQVTKGPAIHGWPRWSPDGTKLAYWEYDPSTGKQAIKTSLLDGSNAQKIVESDYCLDRPEWDPHGNYIAYAATDGSNWDVSVASADGSKKFRMTTDPQMETNPLWSPDGNIIAYKVAPFGQYNLTAENFITLENGFSNPTVHQWVGPESVQMNHWSPDGQKIAYTAEAISQSLGVDRVTYLAVTSDIDLVDGFAVASNNIIVSGGMTLGDRGPVFSPDGKKVLFWAWDQSFRATLWYYDLEREQLVQLTSAGFDMYPQWSPDGKKILFESSRGGNFDIWVMFLD